MRELALNSQWGPVVDAPPPRRSEEGTSHRLFAQWTLAPGWRRRAQTSARMPERELDGKDVQSPGGSPRSPPALVAASAANPAGGGPGRVGHAADAKASPEHFPAAEARKPGDR